MTERGVVTSGENSTCAPTTRRYTRDDLGAVCRLLDLDPEHTTEVMVTPWDVTVTREYAGRPGVGLIRTTTTYPVDHWPEDPGPAPACEHCRDAPPAGHVCPRCGRS
jgi:hypothetical protein